MRKFTRKDLLDFSQNLSFNLNIKRGVLLFALFFTFSGIFAQLHTGGNNCSSPETSGETNMFTNWSAGVFSYTENNIDGSGVNVTINVTGETGVISTIGGGSFNGVDGLDLRSQGFSTSATFTVTFSKPISSTGFTLGHVNGANGSGGDKWTLTALDKFNNTVFPTFVTQGGATSSYDATEATGVVNANGNATTIDNVGVNFSDPDSITQITLVWEECDICAPSFHGTVISDFDFCYTPADNDGDGIGDIDDIDDDNDGITDTQELCGSDPLAILESTPIDVTINLDDYPAETTWDLSGPSGVISSGGPYTAANANQSLTGALTVTENGNYSFTVYDSYGDGLLGNTFSANGVDFSTITNTFTTGSSSTINFTVSSINSSTFSCFAGDPVADNDGDGIKNYEDADFCSLNANGVCTSMDTDGDGIIDIFDLDSDGDGCYDAEEAGHGEAMESDNTIVASSGDVGNNGLDAAVESNDTGLSSLNYTLDETNGGTYDFQDGAVSTVCSAPLDCYGSELIINGDFEDAYAHWTSDLNRGRNNNGPTSGGCGSQGWVAVSPCATTNGVCNDYYSYNGGTPTGNTLITDSYGTGANVLPTTNCNSTSNSCLAEGLPDHTSGTGFSVYIDPNDIAGNSFWKQTVTIEANKVYEFSAWVMVIENTPNIDFKIDGNSLTSGISLTRQTGGSNGTDVWQNISTTWASGATSGNVVIELVNLVSSCSQNDFRIDDISLREMKICDADNDGIADADDLDDDNDGILDTDECYTTLSSTPIPDGNQDGNFPLGYWDAEYFEGHFGIPNSTYGNSATDSDGAGNNGTPIFMGEAYFGVNTLTFTDSRTFTENQTPTSVATAPTGYVGTNSDGNGNPYYQIHFNRKMDTDGTLTFGGSGYFDDVMEVFVNGTQEVFAGGCCGASPNPNSTVINVAYLAGDDVQIRYANFGWIGGYEFSFVMNNDGCKDTDNDGIPDFQDLDSDNDGIPDLVEAGGVDTDGDGKVDGNIDSDGDGVPDYADPDDPSCTFGDASAPVDGICDNVQGGTDTDGDGIQDSDDLDSDGDGILDTYDSDNGGTAIPNLDSDNDGIADVNDLDADNDGIPDVVEAGGTDANGDGIADNFVDTDGDGFNDVVDGDVGNDGAENTADALIVTGTDTDNDGTPDSFVSGDTDGDGLLDQTDLDADNDGLPDVVEAGGTDVNGDGIADGFVDVDGDGFNDVVDGDPDNSLPTGDDSADTNTADALILTGTDTDGDGEPNSFPEGDTDRDGILDHMDLDADNDGIPDVVEAGGTDANGDGIADDFADVDGDGFNDTVDGDPDNSLPTGDDSSDTNTADALQPTGADTDGDGEPNSYPEGDNDGDGILDQQDLDADNDGIPDVVEAGGTDVNGDGIADDFADVDGDGFNDTVDGDPTNALPTGNDTAGANTSDALQPTGVDTDGDGEPNSYPEGDTDGDGILDQQDLDADNDGIPDVVEAGGTDANGDGIADDFADVDNDGFNDVVDGDPDNSLPVGDDSADSNTSDALVLTGADTDGDGEPNSFPEDDNDGDGILDHLDLDADNDGIPDVVEAGGTDANGDGIADDFADLDGDGFNDTVDGDPDNSLPTGDDSADTNSADALQPTGADTDGDGVPNSYPEGDQDGDGNLDQEDLDTDNDGIPDVVESGGTDENGDGIADGFADVDGDGFNDTVDGDPDNSLPTGDDSADTNTANAQVLTGTDTDGDGEPNSYPTDDTDGDGILDHLDLDADNDGIPDVVEAGGTDANGDGIADDFADLDGDGFNDTVDGDPDNSLPIGDDSADTNSADALQPTGADTDGDGVPNSYPEGDNDGDGLLDQIDLDADNDGIPDVVESGGIDTDGNGLADSFADLDNDGFNDTVDGDPDNSLPTGDDSTDTNTANAQVLTGTDTDGDGVPNSYPNDDTDGDGNLDHLDLDADNDGIPDLVEAGGIDTDGDGQVDTNTDVDQDGLADIYDENASDGPGANGTSGTALVETDVSGTMVAGDDGTEFLDTDGDGLPDHLDLDADNDGIPDVIEAGGNDPEGDGMVDTTSGWDADGDGLADNYDTNDNTVAGTADGSGNALIQTNADTNGDGTVDATAEMMISGGGGDLPINPDGDVVPNHLDIDADNDGIMDVTEAGATDSNNDGMVDDGTGAFVDTDGDGFADGVDGDVGNDGSFESSNPLITTGADDTGDSDDRLEYAGNGISDSDSDDVPDFLDVDSDNDGIYDNYEGQSTAGYIPPGTMDTDGDGLLDAYDTGAGAAQNGITPYNHDAAEPGGDTVPDYLDLDADADNIPDIQEAWDNMADGDSQGDNVTNCNNIDTDGDGLIDCFDSDDADPTVYTWQGDPADDTDGATQGTVFTNDLDDILPDNIGNDPLQPDYRDNLNACATAQVYYGITEASAGTTTDFEYNSVTSLHEDGAATNVVRATTYCEPNGDGWYYYYNPMEPENYLFAIKNSAGSPNTVPMWDIVDYIEIKKENDQANRSQVGATDATHVMTRDWNVVFKGTPTVGSTFDVKFYFLASEMADLDAAADYIEAQAQAGGGSYTRDFIWMKKAGGLTNADISPTGITGEQDITVNDLDGIDETNTGNTDGTVVDAGNGKNYVEFTGLTSFSGGAAAIGQTFSVLLPVELKDFKAKTDGCNVNLIWETESEKDFDYFDLEWSGNGQDFRTIETIEAIGGDFTQVYSFKDRQASSFNYYRLKMVDLDGSYKYSNIVSKSTGCEDTHEVIIYPNPVSPYNGILNVKFYSERPEAQLQITDMLGRVVKRLTLDVESEFINTVQLDISDLPVGNYNIMILGDKKSKMFTIQE